MNEHARGGKCVRHLNYGRSNSRESVEFLWNSKCADSVWAYTYNSVEETENVSNHNGKTGEFRTQIL